MSESPKPPYEPPIVEEIDTEGLPVSTCPAAATGGLDGDGAES